MANLSLAPTSAAGIGQTLGLTQGGAPASVLGYKQTAPGNNGQPVLSGGADPLAGYYKQLLDAQNASNALIQQQLQQSYLPYFDILGNYNQAKGAAAGVVNPLYQAKLNDYLKQEQVNKERKQADFATTNTQLEDALKTALEASGISRDRTSQDVASNLGLIANQEQNFQQDTGLNFDRARSALSGNVAQAGLTTSGLGAQQQADQQFQRNTTEGRQVQAFDTQKQAQNLLKTRTFEDLGRADVQVNKQVGQQKDAVKLDLDRYLQDLATQEAQTRNDLDLQRLGAIAAETQNQERLGVNRFLSTLRGSALKNAAAAYRV